MKSSLSSGFDPVSTPLTTAPSTIGLTPSNSGSTDNSISPGKTGKSTPTSVEDRNDLDALAIVSWLSRSGRSGNTSTSIKS